MHHFLSDRRRPVSRTLPHPAENGDGVRAISDSPRRQGHHRGTIARQSKNKHPSTGKNASLHTKWCVSSPIERGSLQRVLSAARRSRNPRVGVRVDLAPLSQLRDMQQKKTASHSGCRNPLPLEPRGRASRLFPVGRIRRPGHWLRAFAAYDSEPHPRPRGSLRTCLRQHVSAPPL